MQSIVLKWMCFSCVENSPAGPGPEPWRSWKSQVMESCGTPAWSEWPGNSYISWHSPAFPVGSIKRQSSTIIAKWNNSLFSNQNELLTKGPSFHFKGLWHLVKAACCDVTKGYSTHSSTTKVSGKHWKSSLTAVTSFRWNIEPRISIVSRRDPPGKMEMFRFSPPTGLALMERGGCWEYLPCFRSRNSLGLSWSG